MGKHQKEYGAELDKKEEDIISKKVKTTGIAIFFRTLTLNGYKMPLSFVKPESKFLVPNPSPR